MSLVKDSKQKNNTWSLTFVYGGMHMYLSLEVKGHHGETEVKQEVLLLEALQSSAHTERHHVGPLDEQRGAEHVNHAQTHDAHETNLQPETHHSR